MIDEEKIKEEAVKEVLEDIRGQVLECDDIDEVLDVLKDIFYDNNVDFGDKECERCGKMFVGKIKLRGDDVPYSDEADMHHDECEHCGKWQFFD